MESALFEVFDGVEDDEDQGKVQFGGSKWRIGGVVVTSALALFTSEKRLSKKVIPLPSFHSPFMKNMHGCYIFFAQYWPPIVLNLSITHCCGHQARVHLRRLSRAKSSASSDDYNSPQRSVGSEVGGSRGGELVSSPSSRMLGAHSGSDTKISASGRTPSFAKSINEYMARRHEVQERVRRGSIFHEVSASQRGQRFLRAGGLPPRPAPSLLLFFPFSTAAAEGAPHRDRSPVYQDPGQP